MKQNNINIVGARIDLLTLKDLNRLVLDHATDTEIKSIVIAHHNLHSLYLIQKNNSLQKFYQEVAFISFIDGMSLIFIGKLLGYKLNRNHRVTYVDWIEHLLTITKENDLRLFFLGSKPEVSKKAVTQIKKLYPGINIEFHHGYFNKSIESVENQEVLSQIKYYNPDILMVGMGMPLQEYWIMENYDNLNAKVILTVGACMDYIAGEIPVPPRWMGKIGLEWLYRFICEPKRLFSRYFIEPFYLVEPLIKSFLNKRID